MPLMGLKVISWLSQVFQVFLLPYQHLSSIAQIYSAENVMKPSYHFIMTVVAAVERDECQWHVAKSI